MPIGRSTFTPLLATNLRRICMEAGQERPREYPFVFNVQEMESNPVTDRYISGLGTMPGKAEGDTFALDQPILGGTSTYTAEAFALAFEVTWEMWRDEMYGVMQDFAAHLGRSGRNREETQAWAVLNNAFSASYPGFDGAALCSTSHSGLDGVTRANRPSPDIGFSITGIQNAILAFEGMTNERNMTEVMTPVMCLIRQENKFAAREILGSGGKPYGSDQELNALIEDDLRYMVCHFLTTATNWFVLAQQGVHDLNFLWRDHPIFSTFDDPWTMNGVFALYQRHASGFSRYRGVWGSTG